MSQVMCCHGDKLLRVVKENACRDSSVGERTDDTPVWTGAEHKELPKLLIGRAPIEGVTRVTMVV